MARKILLRLEQHGLTFAGESELFHHLLVFRVALVHQISLQSPVSSLYEQVKVSADKLVSLLKPHQDQLSEGLFLSLLNQLTVGLVTFGDAELSRKSFEQAINASNLDWNLSGAYGVRTQFQTKEVAQLTVEARHKTGEKMESSTTTTNMEVDTNIELPVNEKLEDDTLLPSVRFTKKLKVSYSNDQKEEEQQVHLTPEEQCLMINGIRIAVRFGPSSDQLLGEEQLAYIYFLLEKCRTWSVTYVLLELRSLYERSSSRKVERSMKQFEALSYCLRNCPQLKVDSARRLECFYSCLPSPFWTIEKHLADLLLGLGVVKAALDVYERLAQWREVIHCYRHIGRADRAEQILRERLLAGEQTPAKQAELHCLLGEITNSPEHFRQSWLVSGKRYARAPKMLGLWHFGRQEWAEALEHLKVSVEVNSMQTDAWYRIGYINLTQSNWEEAANAYRHVLQFDESFEAWNNLSKAYIKLGDKVRAFRTLKEAIRCNFEEWRVWENLVAVAADVGAFRDLLSGWHRLIDLKGRYVDDQLIEILEKAVVEDVQDCFEQGSRRYLSDVLSLFGRIAATSAGSGRLWQAYARLLLLNEEQDLERVVQMVSKAARQYRAEFTTWREQPQQAREYLSRCSQLVHLLQECAEQQQQQQPQASPVVLEQIRASCFGYETIVRAAYKAHQDFVQQNQDMSGRFPVELLDELETCSRAFEENVNKLSMLCN